MCLVRDLGAYRSYWLKCKVELIRLTVTLLGSINYLLFCLSTLHGQQQFWLKSDGLDIKNRKSRELWFKLG